jgi:hypothetical protein
MTETECKSGIVYKHRKLILCQEVFNASSHCEVAAKPEKRSLSERLVTDTKSL